MISWDIGTLSYVGVDWKTREIELTVDTSLELLRGEVTLRSSSNTVYYDNISLVTDIDISTVGTNISIWEVVPIANKSSFVFINPIKIELLKVCACFDTDTVVSSDCTLTLINEATGLTLGSFTLKANENYAGKSLIDFSLVEDTLLDINSYLSIKSQQDLAAVKIVLVWKVGDL